MKPFTIVEAAQRSPEWRQARCGLLTGSRAADMLATIKSGEAAARRDLRTQLVCERLTGEPQEDGFVSAVMQWGIDREGEARAAYEALSGNFITETGLLVSRTARAGCSLDGHVGDVDGIVELKCPKSATHLEYLQSGTVPAKHLPQLTHNLWVSGAAWCDFVSFDPRFPPELRVWIARVDRDEHAVLAYAAKALVFLGEVDRDEAAVRALSTRQAVA